MRSDKVCFNCNFIFKGLSWKGTIKRKMTKLDKQIKVKKTENCFWWNDKKLTKTLISEFLEKLIKDEILNCKYEGTKNFHTNKQSCTFYMSF